MMGRLKRIVKAVFGSEVAGSLSVASFFIVLVYSLVVSASYIVGGIDGVSMYGAMFFLLYVFGLYLLAYLFVDVAVNNFGGDLKVLLVGVGVGVVMSVLLVVWAVYPVVGVVGFDVFLFLVTVHVVVFGYVSIVKYMQLFGGGGL